MNPRKQSTKPTAQKTFLGVWVDTAVKKAIQDAAFRNHRSVAGEIRQRLVQEAPVKN